MECDDSGGRCEIQRSVKSQFDELRRRFFHKCYLLITGVRIVHRTRQSTKSLFSFIQLKMPHLQSVLLHILTGLQLCPGLRRPASAPPVDTGGGSQQAVCSINTKQSLQSSSAKASLDLSRLTECLDTKASNNRASSFTAGPFYYS